MIIVKTPLGFRNVKTTFPRRSLGMTAVSIRFTSSAAIRRLPAVSSISSTASVRNGLPCSSASSRARSSARSSTMSAARCRSAARSCAVISSSSGCASRAARTAASISPGLVTGTSPSSSPVAGLRTWIDAVIAMGATLDCRTVTPTPLETAPASLAQGRDVWLKREDQHELGAFKWRGALPAMRGASAMRADDGRSRRRPGTTARRRHGRQRGSGMRAIVYAPEGSARAKLDLIERHGGEMRAFGADFDLAKDEAERVAAADGMPFFADGAEQAQYGGYAEIADEVLDQLGRAPGAIVVPVGNGALLGGIGLRLAEWAPGTLADRRRRHRRLR